MELIYTMGEGFQNPFSLYSLNGAPGGIRTPNNGSEDRYDIHFTTGAMDVSYGIQRGNQKNIVDLSLNGRKKTRIHYSA